jgi:hypothetical protein
MPISEAEAAVAVQGNVNATGNRFIVPGQTTVPVVPVAPVGRRLLRSA